MMKQGNQFYLQLQIYDNENDSSFNIFLTEEETFNFKNHINVEARVLFKNDTILGTLIENTYVSDCLKKVKMDVETKNN